MAKRTRERQLRKLAERRALERRHQRRRRAVLIGLVVLALVAGAGGTLLALLRSDEPAATAQSAVACGGEVPAAADAPRPTYDEPPPLDIDERLDYVAVVRTSCGTVQLDLFEKKTPITVNNFMSLASDGFYDGLTFHRVDRGFVIQGGDPKGTGSGGPGYEFEDEIVNGLEFDRPGLLAMANSGPDTNGSQFFVTVAQAEHLNGKHTIFGRVESGMDVVRRINDLPADANERPEQTVYIERVTIEAR